jgi:hypothetical protein
LLFNLAAHFLAGPARQAQIEYYNRWSGGSKRLETGDTVLSHIDRESGRFESMLQNPLNGGVVFND